MEDLKQKQRQEADLHRQREELIRQHHQGLEQRDILSSYAGETQALEQLRGEAEREKRELEAEIRAAVGAMSERADRMA